MGNPHYLHRHMRLPRLPDGILHHLTLRCRFYVAVQGGNKGNQEITTRHGEGRLHHTILLTCAKWSPARYSPRPAMRPPDKRGLQNKRASKKETA